MLSLANRLHLLARAMWALKNPWISREILAGVVVRIWFQNDLEDRFPGVMAQW